MIAEKMKRFVKNSSAVRAMFEEGKELARIYGEEHVYDFSLGNPNLPTPKAVEEAMIEIITKENSVELHGYMNNSGHETVRETIARDINKKYDMSLNASNILMTVGAAGGLNVILKTILNPEEEVLVFAPYFGEYKNYVENYDGVLVSVSPNPPSFLPSLKEFEDKLTPKTKAVIINTPNNPTGVVYPKEFLEKLSDILRKKEKEFQTSIYLISDEPYRELVYEEIEVPYIPNLYGNTIVGYSFSKSLSLPGERIGYLVFPNTLDDFEDMVMAANTANRILGFVNAPSLFQKVVAKSLNQEVDISYYKRNRDTLYDGLSSLGLECVKPEGAFYLFVKSPVENEQIFCEKAKEYRILMVPGSGYGCSGYVRLAYCVSYEKICASLLEFKKLMKENF